MAPALLLWSRNGGLRFIEPAASNDPLRAMGEIVQRVLLLVLTATTLALPCAAQELALELRAGRVSSETGNGRPGISISPAVAWAGRSWAAEMGGELLLSAERRTTGAGTFELRLLPSGQTLAAQLALAGSVRGVTGEELALGLSAAPTVGLTGRAWSVAAGPHIGVQAMQRSEEGDFGRPWSFLDSSTPTRIAGRMVYGFVVDAGAGNGPLRIRAALRNSRVGDAQWTDVRAGAVLEGERATLALHGGWRAGDLSEKWAAVDGALQVMTRASLVGGFGRYAADPLSGRVPGMRAEIGIRLSTGHRAAAPVQGPPLSTSPADGLTRLVLTAEPGSNVELVADWTAWRPTPVDEVEPGLYRITVRLPVGKHRFAFLVDGVRRLPEGFATERSDYGDSHAVVRVTDS